MTGSLYIHEYSHKWDYRNIEKTNEKVCVIYDCGDGNLGRYSFKLTNTNEYDKVLEIKKYTEYKAYLMQFDFVLINTIIALLLIGRYKKNTFIKGVKVNTIWIS